MTEDVVVARTCAELERRGFRIVVQATSTQHGYDIVAVRGPTKLIVEAKGAGSSKPGTNRFGYAFNSNQVFDHVAKAVLKAIRVIASGDAVGAIALPDNPDHRIQIDQAQPFLRDHSLLVIWVGDDYVRFDPEELIS